MFGDKWCQFYETKFASQNYQLHQQGLILDSFYLCIVILRNQRQKEQNKLVKVTIDKPWSPICQLWRWWHWAWVEIQGWNATHPHPTLNAKLKIQNRHQFRSSQTLIQIWEKEKREIEFRMDLDLKAEQCDPATWTGLGRTIWANTWECTPKLLPWSTPCLRTSEKPRTRSFKKIFFENLIIAESTWPCGHCIDRDAV